MQLWKLLKPNIAPEEVVRLFGWFPITNTLICTWISIIILLLFFYFATRRKALIPSGLQNFAEWIVEIFYGIVEGVSGKEKARRFFPIVGGFFFFIVVANILDIIPGVDTIGTVEHTDPNVVLNPVVFGPIALLFGNNSDQLIPWLRPATTDLNLNLAMAIVSVVITQFFGFLYLGAGEHLSKYFNFRALFKHGGIGAVEFFAGLIEIISETMRIISFAFRLFGNIFAGSVLLAVFAFLLPALANILFIPFELFVAVIQAFVFGFLTLLFMEVATTSHSQHEDHAEPAHAPEATVDETVTAH